MNNQEFNEEQLKNVVGGTTYQNGKEIFDQANLGNDELSIDEATKVLGGTTYDIGKQSFESMQTSDQKLEDMLNRDGSLEEFNNFEVPEDEEIVTRHM